MWESELRLNGGDYMKTWLKQLGKFIFINNRPPNVNDEGWTLLDGTYGIKLLNYNCYEFDDFNFEIKTVE
jgi:hypothetical protein